MTQTHKPRRWLHGRSYQQMLDDGDLPEPDSGERITVIMTESYIRGLEQGAIFIIIVAVAFLAWRFA